MSYRKSVVGFCSVFLLDSVTVLNDLIHRFAFVQPTVKAQVLS